MCKSEHLSCIDASVVDAMLIIMSKPDLPNTYGGIAEAILKRILKTSINVHFLCDSYSDDPSIKDMEHTVRSARDGNFEYSIAGLEQKRAKNFHS